MDTGKRSHLLSEWIACDHEFGANGGGRPAYGGGPGQKGDRPGSPIAFANQRKREVSSRDSPAFVAVRQDRDVVADFAEASRELEAVATDASLPDDV
jgi:hypothetical protein